MTAEQNKPDSEKGKDDGNPKPLTQGKGGSTSDETKDGCDKSKGDKKPTNEGRKLWKDESTGGRISIFIGGVLAFFTMLLAIFTILLVTDNRKQIDISKKASDSSYVISKQSIARSDSALALTKASLDLSEKNFEIENRAFVILDGVKSDRMVYEVGKPIFFVFDIKNVGNTPAYIRFSGDIAVCDSITFTKIFPSAKQLDDEARKDVVRVLGGKSEYLPSRYEHALLKGTDDRLKSGEFHWYAWGNFIYKDFFGKEHHTHVCGIYDIKVGFYTIGNYNDAD